MCKHRKYTFKRQLVRTTECVLQRNTKDANIWKQITVYIINIYYVLCSYIHEYLILLWNVWLFVQKKRSSKTSPTIARRQQSTVMLGLFRNEIKYKHVQDFVFTQVTISVNLRKQSSEKSSYKCTKCCKINTILVSLKFCNTCTQLRNLFTEKFFGAYSMSFNHTDRFVEY